MTRSRRNALGGAAFLVLGILGLYLGLDLQTGSVLVPGPGALPKAALLGMVVLSGLLVAGGRRETMAGQATVPEEMPEPEVTSEPGAAMRVAVAIACIAAFVLALPMLGFLISSAALMAVLAGLGATKPWSVGPMLGGLATALAAYLLFVKLLGVPLPAGSLWGA